MEITLDDLVQELGSYKKSGQHYYFQCKYCLDEHKDNMIYTPSKGLLKCFAVDNHASMLLSEIMKKKYADKIDVHVPQYLTMQEKYLEYQISCNNYLLSNDKALVYLQKTRGINRDTVEKVGMGFDKENNKWVIPIFDDTYLVGFEYRGANFKHKKIWREKDTKRCLAHIYGCAKAHTIILCEGMLDAYICVQMLNEYKQLDNTTVASVSNGVNGTLAIMSEIKFNNFDTIKLILDNDEPGDLMTERVLKQYPFVVDARGFLKKYDVKDVTDYYLLDK